MKLFPHVEQVYETKATDVINAMIRMNWVVLNVSKDFLVTLGKLSEDIHVESSRISPKVVCTG